MILYSADQPVPHPELVLADYLLPSTRLVGFLKQRITTLLCLHATQGVWLRFGQLAKPQSDRAKAAVRRTAGVSRTPQTDGPSTPTARAPALPGHDADQTEATPLQLFLMIEMSFAKH